MALIMAFSEAGRAVVTVFVVEWLEGVLAQAEKTMAVNKRKMKFKNIRMCELNL